MGAVFTDTHETVVEGIRVLKNVKVPMRDGVHLAVDIYLPDEVKEGAKLPALLATSPYGKELQVLSLTLPPQARPSPLWDGCIEAGDIRRIVDRGYVHVIADARGSGASGGDLVGNYDSGGHGEGKDIYDLVEWMAVQDWCDGNIGMAGISYFATVQILAAAENPPHLKAIFCNGGHFDLYEVCYHGGIMWFMPRASREGRGGDSGYAVGNIQSKTSAQLTPAEYQARVTERLQDPDVQAWPNMLHLLNYPKNHELWMDWVMNPHDGPFWQNGSAITVADKVTIPAYFQCRWGRGWTVDGHIDAYMKCQGVKKIDLEPMPPMQERPFHENHDDMFRWYDFWLKGIDTGIMDEPQMRLFVDGANKWRSEEQWPLPQTEWTNYYLRPRGRISTEPEPLATKFVPPDGFYQAPFTVTNEIGMLTWTSGEFREAVEMVGPAALYLHVEIDTDDTNFIAKLYDVAPSGKKQMVTSGYLKAAQRELDPELSTPWRPHHPHTRSVPVTPGEINEYAIRLYSFAYNFKVGHKLQLELSCNEPMGGDAHASLLPPDSFHLPSGRATNHKIYRDSVHLSRLLMPVIPQGK